MLLSMGNQPSLASPQHLLLASNNVSRHRVLLVGRRACCLRIVKDSVAALSVKDVQDLTLKLRAKLLLLSCCSTGRGQVNTKGVIGIARAFLRAGARAALASLWQVKHEGALYKEVFPGKIETHLSVTVKVRGPNSMAGDLDSRKVSCK